MKQSFKYHSALKQIRCNEDFPEIEYFKKGKSIAMFNDLTRGLPIEFDKCDVFYSDPPYPAGMNYFNKKSNIQTKYNDLMIAISNIILNKNKPTIITNCKNAVKFFPSPNQILKIKMNSSEVYAYVFNTEIDSSLKTNIDIINYLACKFNTIGDFCCGYGLSGIIFDIYGKSFVLSDYNKKCIGYIKQKYENL